MKKRIPPILCIITLLVFLAIFLQGKFRFVDIKQLNGAEERIEKPKFSFSSCKNGEYQAGIERYSKENFGFRESLIRFYHQYLYSLFGKDATKGFVTGKDGMLFEESYIISYIGETFVGMDKIRKNARQIRLVQDMLAVRNVTLLTVFAPGKASYYPEMIPEYYLKKLDTTNNYKEYVGEFARDSVNLIDFNKYYCDNKGGFEKAIYCNLGAHWTIYAASLAMDSLARYMEAKTGKKHAYFTIDGFVDSDSLINQDDDIYKSMNLMFPIEHNRIDNPILGFHDGYKPKVLAISDSYWWTVWAWNVAIPQNIFSDGGFWFYNTTIYPERNPVQSINDIDYRREIEEQEFVLLVCTEATNHLFPFNFCRRYLASYDYSFVAKSPSDYDAADSIYASYKQSVINDIKNEIVSTPEWLDNVKSQANEKGISVEESIDDNAAYTYMLRLEPEDLGR